MSWLNEPTPPAVNFTSHDHINRVELIDHRASSENPGRAFTSMDVETVMISLQDDGRTLKLFIS